MYVEDYCTQVRLKLGLNIYTIQNNWIWIQNEEEIFQNNPNPYNWVIHHSHSVRSKGAMWGKWKYYKIKLNKKWNKKIPTT